MMFGSLTSRIIRGCSFTLSWRLFVNVVGLIQIRRSSMPTFSMWPSQRSTTTSPDNQQMLELIWKTRRKKLIIRRESKKWDSEVINLIMLPKTLFNKQLPNRSIARQSLVLRPRSLTSLWMVLASTVLISYCGEKDELIPRLDSCLMCFRGSLIYWFRKFSSSLSLLCDLILLWWLVFCLRESRAFKKF